MLKKITLNIIKKYQVFVSPFLGHHCRFYPSCSEYVALSIKKYGVLRGGCLGLRRVFKCHPFGGKGVDMP
jgi:hypothetical protein